MDLSRSPTDEEIGQLVEELVRPGAPQHPELLLRGRSRSGRRLRRPVLAATERRRRRRVAPSGAPVRLEVGTTGVLESLRLTECGVPRLGRGQVEIRVHAAALNFRDVMVAMGMVGHDAQRRPLGLDCAGVVVASEADGVHPGDEVVALGRGMLGSRVTTDATFVVPKPAGLSFAEAATLPVAFVTADVALHGMADMAPGERVLLHSATGGVGLAALQLCQRAGAEVFATAGTVEKRDLLRSLGVEHVMDSRSLDFADEIAERTGGEGVDIVLNSLVGEGRARSLALLRRSGRFVDMAVRDMLGDEVVGLHHFARGISYHAFGAEGDSLPPSWGERLRRLAGEVVDGALQPLPTTEFDLDDAASAFRFMAQARHIGKVVCTVDEPHYWAETADPPLFRPDGTYLLVGGLGGFGLALARWMVRRGARHLVLTSRSGQPLPEDAAALDALRRSDATVTTVRADAANRDDMHRVLAAIRADPPPLAGVAHLAMVLDDDLLGRLDAERFQAVLAPKVAGAWNLHELTADDDLELFLLFSSVSSMFGAPAQSSYAAGNSFLDALAAHRRGLGRPALTVNWGAVGAGYVARHPEVLARSGSAERPAVQMLPTEVAFTALERAMGNDVPRVAIGYGDWDVWFAAFDLARDGDTDVAGSSAGSSRTSGRGSGSGAPAPEAVADDAPPGPQDLLQRLVERTARVFDTRPERIDPDRPLTEMGLDSLMAVELQTMIHQDLGTEVPLVDLLEGISLRRLADELDRSALAGDRA